MLKGSVNEAIKGTGLAGQTVDIENNTVGHAGAAGIQLAGADHLTLTSNDISDSGTRSPSNPAIYLNGVSGANTTTPISDNTAPRNGTAPPPPLQRGVVRPSPSRTRGHEPDPRTGGR